MRLFLLLTFFVTLSFAKVYEKIEMVGLVHLSDFSAQEILEFSKDDDIDEEMIDRAIKNFYSQGYFVDIKVEDLDNTLMFTFKEKPLISKIEIFGVSDTDVEEKYKPIMKLKKGDIYDDSKIEKAKEAIVMLIRAEGYYSTVVEVKKEEIEESIELEFHINKGKKITIYESVFDGAKDFEPSELDNDIANKAKEPFSWFFGQNEGELDLLQLEFDGERLKEFYMKEGYLDVEVDKPFLKADFNNFSAKLFYNIFEGKPYTVTSVDIEILDDKKLDLNESKEQIAPRVGKTFNIKNLRKDLEFIKEEVGSYGYAFVRVLPDIQKDKKTLTAKVIYKVVCGDKVRIRDVIISGNNRTLDRVIRREVFLAPGELYNLREIKESKRALGRLGFFENIELNEKRVDSKQMDLVVNVKETSTGSLQAGGGWNSQSGFTYSASISDRNIFGSSIGFNFSAESSDDSNKFSFSLTNPRFNDGDYSLSTSIYKSYYRTDDYKIDTKGVGVTVGKRLNRYWRASVGTSYSKSDNEYYDISDANREFYIEGEFDKIALKPFLTFNNTDDYFVPRSGSEFSTSLEIASFGGDQEFTKSVTRFATYYGLEDLIDYDIVLRYKAKGSLLEGNIDNSREIPLGSRLYIGGLGSVRGYNRNSISPLDMDDYETSGDKDDILRIGGNRSFSNSLEASFPLIDSARMRYTIFYDMGWIGRDNLDIHRSSYGTAVEWQSPMGPIAFIWGWVLDAEELDETNVFEFTLGQRF